MTDEEIDLIANDGCRNASGGIYATRVYEFARAIERATLGSQQTELTRLRSLVSGEDAQMQLIAQEREALRADAERWQMLLQAVTSEIDDKEYSRPWRHTENAPGHAHDVPGVWDSDNGEMAGKTCAWCMTWNAARAALSAASEGGES